MKSHIVRNKNTILFLQGNLCRLLEDECFRWVGLEALLFDRRAIRRNGVKNKWADWQLIIQSDQTGAGGSFCLGKELHESWHTSFDNRKAVAQAAQDSKADDSFDVSSGSACSGWNDNGMEWNAEKRNEMEWRRRGSRYMHAA